MKRKQMTNKQVKDAMEQCSKTIECLGCPYEDCAACKTAIIRDALRIIDELEERIAIITEGQPEVVLCKDCVHSRRLPSPWNDLICDNINNDVKEEWFCADGKRKEGR